MVRLWRAPRLVPEAVRAGWALRRRRPRPGRSWLSSDHLRWRILTAYGSAEAVPPAADRAAFLEWRRRQRRAR